jgi:hypothetical protein
MRGIKKLAYIAGFFFFLSGKHVVTAGGETWQEVITQVLEVALTFEFSFCKHYSEPLSLSVL